MESELNCISFTYFALGLRRSEKYINPGWPIGYYREFKSVNFVGQGVAVAVMKGDGFGKRERKIVEHMAVIDQNNDNFVLQRGYCGGGIEYLTMSSMTEYYRRVFGGDRISIKVLALSEIGVRKQAENSGNNYLISRLYSKSQY